MQLQKMQYAMLFYRTINWNVIISHVWLITSHLLPSVAHIATWLSKYIHVHISITVVHKWLKLLKSELLSFVLLLSYISVVLLVKNQLKTSTLHSPKSELEIFFSSFYKRKKIKIACIWTNLLFPPRLYSLWFLQYCAYIPLVFTISNFQHADMAKSDHRADASKLGET